MEYIADDLHACLRDEDKVSFGQSWQQVQRSTNEIEVNPFVDIYFHGRPHPNKVHWILHIY